MTAADLLRELSFRSDMQAVAKDGVVELRWPQKTKKYKLDSMVYLVLKQEAFPQECKVVSEYFDGQAWVIEVEQASWHLKRLLVSPRISVALSNALRRWIQFGQWLISQ